MEIFWGLVLLGFVFLLTASFRAIGRKGPGEMSRAEKEMGESHFMMGDPDRERIDTLRPFEREREPGRSRDAS